jgi:hypothetical protein
MSGTHQSVVLMSYVQRQTEQVAGAGRGLVGGALHTLVVELHRQPVQTLDLQGLQVRGAYYRSLDWALNSIL